MLPHNHFLIAGLIISPAAAIFYPEKIITEIGVWVMIGGFLSAVIDFDVYFLVIMKSKRESRLKPFINPMKIYRDFELFMNIIFKTSLWKITLTTHLALAAFLILLFYFFSNAYFIPVALGVISHIISDVPNLIRIKDAAIENH